MDRNSRSGFAALVLAISVVLSAETAGLVQLPGAAFAGAPPPPAPAPGGAEQRPSVEGCLGQWVFNGIWRLRVLSVEPIRKSVRIGYGVTAEIRNGSKKTLSMRLAGISGTGRGVDLIDKAGNPLELDVRDFQKIVSRRLPQGAGVTHQLKFYYPPRTADADIQKPDKLLVEINPQELKKWGNLTAGAAYTVKDPSLRVFLTCPR